MLILTIEIFAKNNLHIDSRITEYLDYYNSVTSNVHSKGLINKKARTFITTIPY